MNSKISKLVDEFNELIGIDIYACQHKGSRLVNDAGDVVRRLLSQLHQDTSGVFSIGQFREVTKLVTVGSGKWKDWWIERDQAINKLKELK